MTTIHADVVDFTDEEHQACAESLDMDSMPPMFTQVILEARANGAQKAPVVVARCPEMSREEFIAWRDSHKEEQ